MKVGVVGLGLIGGSLARDLSTAGHEVVGYDRSQATMLAARRAGAISAVFGRHFGELESCDLFVLAVPVDSAPRLLTRLAPRLMSVRAVTDVGSTKRTIERAARELGLATRFVGSHPMAGDHRSGWAASRRGLFSGARVVLCPARSADPAAMALVRRLWKVVGARAVVMSAKEHDVRVARSSHLPQVASSALATTLSAGAVSRGDLGPGGRDMTRLSGSSPALWSGILLDNADFVATVLAEYRRRLAHVERQIARGDRRALNRWLRDANIWFTGRGAGGGGRR